ncbi:MAG TPA: glycosyltransferase family 4 protein [Tepidiformaceae bacterium]|nr:glycosyltransferase family 4 protein [Tepidiformaceae bacterium]
MKIALVSPYDWSVEGGVKAHITHLASRFRAWGHEVTVFAPASDPGRITDGTIVMGKPRQVPVSGSVARITFAWSSPRVKKALREGHFDVVHLHEPLMPLLPYHFLRYSESATVGTFHAAKEGGNRMYRYTRPFTRRWFRKLEGKIAVSPAAVRLITRYFAGYYNVIPNGIDFEHFSGPHEPVPEFMDGKTNILFVGRPEKRKGLKYLLRAYIVLRARHANVRLIVVGAGDFTRYERAMEGKGDVVFRSNIPYSELPRYHKSAHIFCSPATGNESQGIALLEAMAAGVVVVASNIEGFAGVITDGTDGVLVKPKDANALADAFAALIDDPARREELASRGQQQAVHYSWDSIAHRVLSYYERLIYEREQVAASRKLKLPTLRPHGG